MDPSCVGGCCLRSPANRWTHESVRARPPCLPLTCNFLVGCTSSAGARYLFSHLPCHAPELRHYALDRLGIDLARPCAQERLADGHGARREPFPGLRNVHDSVISQSDCEPGTGGSLYCPDSPFGHCISWCAHSSSTILPRAPGDHSLSLKVRQLVDLLRGTFVLTPHTSLPLPHETIIPSPRL
jgi:hypothetical protein